MYEASLARLVVLAAIAAERGSGGGGGGRRAYATVQRKGRQDGGRLNARRTRSQLRPPHVKGACLPAHCCCQARKRRCTPSACPHPRFRTLILEQLKRWKMKSCTRVGLETPLMDARQSMPDRDARWTNPMDPIDAPSPSLSAATPAVQGPSTPPAGLGPHHGTGGSHGKGARALQRFRASRLSKGILPTPPPQIHAYRTSLLRLPCRSGLHRLFVSL